MDETLSRRTLTKAAGLLAGAAAVGQFTEAAAGEQVIEMRVVDVRRTRAADTVKNEHVVLLEQVGGKQVLPIWIGESEATALALQIERVDLPRPLTYAFAAGLLQAGGGRLREVRISQLVETTFYAEAVVEGPEGVATVDARPSDALNLALLTNAPIRVDPSVLEAAKASSSMQWDAEGVENAAAIAGKTVAEWSAPRPSR